MQAGDDLAGWQLHACRAVDLAVGFALVDGGDRVGGGAFPADHGREVIEPQMMRQHDRRDAHECAQTVSVDQSGSPSVPSFHSAPTTAAAASLARERCA